MKIIIKCFLSSVLAVGLISCPQNVSTVPDNSVLTANPVHITWDENREEIEGYRAEVSVYTMNSRKDTSASLVDNYTMSLKKIDGKTLFRVDMGADDEGRMRSMVSDGSEMVLFETNTNKEEYERLSGEGRAFPNDSFVFGDPSDLSFTKTIIEVYQNVEINTVQNSAFRVLGGF